MILIETFNEGKFKDLDKEVALGSFALKVEVKGESPDRAMQALKDATRAIANSVAKEHDPSCRDCVVFKMASMLVRAIDEIDEELKGLIAAKLAEKNDKIS